MRVLGMEKRLVALDFGASGLSGPSALSLDVAGFFLSIADNKLYSYISNYKSNRFFNTLILLSTLSDI